MSKEKYETTLNVNGTAKAEFAADRLVIKFEIISEDMLSAIAIEKGKAQTEKLLFLLTDMGYDLTTIENESESIKECVRHDEIYNRFKKKIKMILPAEQTHLERITNAIAEKQLSVTYETSYELSTQKAEEEKLLAKAIRNSECNAKILSKAMGQKTVRLKTAHINDKYGNYRYLKKSITVDSYEYTSQASKLIPNKIELEMSVDAVWVIE